MSSISSGSSTGVGTAGRIATSTEGVCGAVATAGGAPSMMPEVGMVGWAPFLAACLLVDTDTFNRNLSNPTSAPVWLCRAQATGASSAIAAAPGSAWAAATKSLRACGAVQHTNNGQQRLLAEGQARHTSTPSTLPLCSQKHTRGKEGHGLGHNPCAVCDTLTYQRSGAHRAWCLCSAFAVPQ